MELITKQGFKQTEVGLIPEDWTLESIVDFASITTGGSDTQDKIDDGEYPFYVRSNQIERINKYTFDGEAILTSGDGVGVGKVFHYVTGKFDYHQRVYNIYDYRKNVDGKYLFFQFSTNFYEKVMSMTAKSSVDSVRREMIADMKIPLPPTLEEQKAIATALSDVDDLIANLDKLIDKKKAIKQGAMQELLTSPVEGGKRLPGFSGEWEERSFTEMIWFQEGPGLRKWQFTTKGIKVINITNLVNGYLDLDKTQRHISWDEFNKMYQHFEVDEGDIVVASSGNSYCKTSVVRKQDLPLVMNTSVIRFKPLKNLDYYLLLILLKSDIFKDQIDLLITGGAQPNFGPAHLPKVFFTLPESIEEQRAIAQILSDMDLEIEQLEAKKDKYKQVKQGMMQELLTGKTRLV